jgi:hypothetical protein
MTAKEIIRAALRQINAIGARQEPSAEDYDACLEYLNNLGDSWSAEGLLVFAYSREEFTLVAGQSSYTIGTGGNFNTDRPAYIDSAQIQYPNSDVDYDVEIVPQNQYDKMSLKTVQGQPTMLFYNPTYPTGTVYLFYTPDQAFTLRLNMRARLGELATISTTVSFPEEYRRALVFNLAVDIANMFGFDPPQTTARIARETKDMLMSRNSSNDNSIAEFDLALRPQHRRRGITRGDFLSGN